MITKNSDKFRTPQNLDNFSKTLDKFRTPRFTNDKEDQLLTDTDREEDVVVHERGRKREKTVMQFLISLAGIDFKWSKSSKCF
jgi:hypothetical protein